LQAALEKVDAGSLALLQQTTQQQLLIDGDQVLDWQVQQAQSNLEATQASLLLAQHRQQFNSSQEVNAGEITAAALTTTAQVMKTIAAATHVTAAVAHIAPDATVGAAGFGGSPYAVATDGGTHAGHAASSAGFGITGISDLTALAGSLTATIAGWGRRADNWSEAAKEAGDQIDQANAQIAAGQFALQVAELNQTLHQEQIDNLQKQIDLLNDKFTDDALYDWMVSSLAATYFQSYQLAVQVCKQLERCYRFELGVADSSFIQFGYWDSLHKGLLAGETLNHDLRRMESSYLQQNARRYELSRFVSLSQLDPLAFRLLLVSGACDFDLPESLFDHDYPGHYNRRLVRVSLTVVYPNPGKFDNVKTTLTLVANKVRTSPDATPGYAEAPIGSDPRFVYDYAAVPQKIATGNAQDDPGLFVQAIASNITDQRYLPFENAGAVSSWHLELPEQYNEVDLSTVGDVVLHLHYTALEGGADLQQAVEQNNAATAPTSGIKVFSALNDFPAPTATVANPYPLTPWQTFLSTVTAPANQVLTLAISPSKFPPFVRGRTITVTAVDVLTVSWPPGNFVVQVNPPLETTPTTLTMTPLPGVSEPNICAATVNPPAGAGLGTWSFEIQKQGAADFRSLGHNDLGDVILLVHYDVS
jgi:hypothetical protein